MMKRKKSKHKVEFVSYSGKYPCLCFGKLVLKIDGKMIKFDGYSRKDSKSIYPRFWESGGNVSFDKDWNENVTRGKWALSYVDKKDYPKEVFECLKDALKAMNDNVHYGCCGGCV